MSVISPINPGPAWTVDAFKAFWGKPDPARVAAVEGILTDDIVGYWPRPIGTVRGRGPYQRVIAAVLEECHDFALTVPEHAESGAFHFVRWVATGTGPDGPFEFTGCDRLRTRGGLVCENYVFCDHPYFARVAARILAPA